LNWTTFGHKKAIQGVYKAYLANRLSHAYLIIGNENVGKTTLSLDIAKLVNCTSENKPCSDCQNCKRIDSNSHTDVSLIDIFSEKNSATSGIDELREAFIAKTNRKPFEGSCRVFILQSIDNMRVEQSNILLKTLEEPPEDTIVILLAENINSVLETIRSRCQLIFLDPLQESEVLEYLNTQFSIDDQVMLKNITKLSQGRLGRAIKMINDPREVDYLNEIMVGFLEIFHFSLIEKFDFSQSVALKLQKNRTKTINEINLWLSCLRDLLLIKSGFENDIYSEDYVKLSNDLSFDEIFNTGKAIEETLALLDLNINPRLTLDNFMLRVHHVN
tara:strand:+ start:1250 stop:2242 length:993 start_codon:yes stop_codon:yes gene_type:complete